MEAILGTEVVNGKGEVVPVSSFAGSGKLVGIYFSAHWCPPCRGFTPVLAEFYKKVKAEAKGANFEIVFISSDRDAASFKEYFDTMPWLALAFDKRDIKEQMSTKFGVRGIPTFIILDGATGEVKEADGRGKVSSDPQGQSFPWGL